MRKTLAMMVLTLMMAVTVTGCQQSQPTDFSTVTTIEPKAVAQLLEEQGVKLYPVKVTDNSIDLLDKRPLVYYTEGRNNYLLIYDLDNPLKRDEVRNDLMWHSPGAEILTKHLMDNYHLKPDEATVAYQGEWYRANGFFCAKNLLIIDVGRFSMQGYPRIVDEDILYRLDKIVKESIMGVQLYTQTKETDDFIITMTVEQGGYWWENEQSQYSYNWYFDQWFRGQVQWCYHGQPFPSPIQAELTIYKPHGSLSQRFEWDSQQTQILEMWLAEMGNNRSPIGEEFTTTIKFGDREETVQFQFDFDDERPEEWR